MESIKTILDKANKTLLELENLEKSGSKGKFFDKTKISLKSNLNHLIDEVISNVSGRLKYTDVNNFSSQDETYRIDLKGVKRFRNRFRKEKKKSTAKEANLELRKSNFYVMFANLLFKNISNKLLKKGSLNEIHLNVRKSGLNILVHSYVSIILLNTVLAFIFGILFGLVISFFDFGIILAPIPITVKILPFVLGDLVRNLVVWPVLFAGSLLTLSYYYPLLESNIKRSKLNDELPFAIIHMSAIAGSGVEPTKIFKLISGTKEYKEFRKETRRVVNKINIYGYDLTTALKDTAHLSPSDKVKDLFNGMSTIITTGGDLKMYLEKKADDSMVEYKLNRKKFAEVAGTYSDIYTGVLIAAPLIFGVMIAIMAPLGGKVFGIDVENISILGLIAIFVVNVLFIGFMKLVQPSE